MKLSSSRNSCRNNCQKSEIAAIINSTVDELGGGSLKDMGRMMAHLREHHAGSMDFGKASAVLKHKD